MESSLVGHGAGQERDAAPLSRDGRASKSVRPFLPQFALDPYLILHEALRCVTSARISAAQRLVFQQKRQLAKDRHAKEQRAFIRRTRSLTYPIQ